ncbi:MAG: hypothetical protein AAFY06_00160 [Pseudomonadota bacterium]
MSTATKYIVASAVLVIAGLLTLVLWLNLVLGEPWFEVSGYVYVSVAVGMVGVVTWLRE